MSNWKTHLDWLEFVGKDPLANIEFETIINHLRDGKMLFYNDDVGKWDKVVK